MILTTALFGIKEFIMILVVIVAISYFTVQALNNATNKEIAKAMKAPIETAKEMGLEISDKYEKNNEILSIGKNYAFVMKYGSSSGEYRAYIYEKENGTYKFTVSAHDYNVVLNAAKELVENLDKI